MPTGVGPRPWLLGVREGWLGHCWGLSGTWEVGLAVLHLFSPASSLLDVGVQGSGMFPVLPVDLGGGGRAVETQNWPYFLRVVWGPQGGPQPQPHWPEPAGLWECSEPRVGGQAWFAFFWNWGVSGGSCENLGKGPFCWGLVEWGGGVGAEPGLKKGC